MQVLLLIAAIVLGLIMIPFGMPGTLVMFAAALCYYLLVPGGGIGLMTVIGVGVLMAVAEGLEWVLTSRFTKKYGGSRRAGWGAIIGGMVGAFVFEWSREQNHGVATRVAWGALLGRVVAAAVKVAIGLAMAAWMIGVVLL